MGSGEYGPPGFGHARVCGSKFVCVFVHVCACMCAHCVCAQAPFASMGLCSGQRQYGAFLPGILEVTSVIQAMGSH